MAAQHEEKGWFVEIYRGCVIHNVSYEETNPSKVISTILENWSGQDVVRRLTLSKKTRLTLTPEPIVTEQGRFINVLNGETLRIE